MICQIDYQQREYDRCYFYNHYNKWLAEAVKPGSPFNRHTIEHLNAIEEMGKRAVPFLYELAKEDVVMNDVLEEIYDCQFKEEPSDNPFEEEIQFNRLRDNWIKKIEEDDDIILD